MSFRSVFLTFFSHLCLSVLFSFFPSFFVSSPLGTDPFSPFPSTYVSRLALPFHLFLHLFLSVGRLSFFFLFFLHFSISFLFSGFLLLHVYLLFSVWPSSYFPFTLRSLVCPFGFFLSVWSFRLFSYLLSTFFLTSVT